MGWQLWIGFLLIDQHLWIQNEESILKKKNPIFGGKKKHQALGSYNHLKGSVIENQQNQTDPICNMKDKAATQFKILILLFIYFFHIHNN